jgi:hypothetical protein
MLWCTLTLTLCAAGLFGISPRADAATLTDATWSSSSTTVGATVTMTVPSGTSGTPTLGTVSPTSLTDGSITLVGTTLTYSFSSVAVSAGTAFSIQVNGLTNTGTAGSYTSEIATRSLDTSIDSGVTPSVSFAGPLTLTAPGSLSWGATLTGSNLSAVDTTAGDQQLTVDDATGSNAGWHITLAATTFTSGADTLPDTGTFVFTGSISSVTASSAPSASCVTTCTLPEDTATYPVAITTASSSPPATTIYDVPAGSGAGAITLGGHSSADPVGWWINVPANARVGTYTSTVTLDIISGP